MRRRRFSPATQKKYSHFLALFVRWAMDSDLNAITADSIENEYLAWWEREFELAQIARLGFDRGAGRAPGANTLRLHLNALASFYAWAERFDHIDCRNPMRRIERVAHAPKRNDWLRPDEDEALLRAACRGAAQGRHQQKAIVWALRFLGVRVGELVSIRNRDVDLEQGDIVIMESKSQDGLRRIPIHPELRPELVEWMRYQMIRGLHAPATPLFATRTGKRMSTSQVERTVKIVAGRAGLRPWPTPMGQDNISQISPHTLRRTFGSALLNQGVRIEVVSALLGHADTRITQKAYAELLQATVAREVRERW
jgi:integrase/recombinase XerD